MLVSLAVVCGCERGIAEQPDVVEPSSTAATVADDDGKATAMTASEPMGDQLGAGGQPDFPTVAKPAEPTACSDGKDNDGDGLVDWQYDLGCYGPNDATEGQLKTREIDHGWSVFEPSKETRIIYVSSSTGKDSNRGTSPNKPKKTLAAALAATRSGHPDWVLLARGDVWYESIRVREGRSRSKPFLVATYGDSTERPLLKTGAKAGVKTRRRFRYNNFAVVGISFHAHTRDPDSAEYKGPAGENGFNFYSKGGETGQGVLIEDCWFNFYTNNVVQGEGKNRDIVLRRNVITNNYNDQAHAQGVFSKNASILLEENVLDHNGWYKRQVDGGHDRAEGQATMFNHNTYFVNQHQTTFRGNIFSRPSSINNKWTAQDGPGSTSDVVTEDNLYIDGEIGISIGGNDKVHPYRFKNMSIRDNVFLDMGRTRPTNRNLGWYLYVDDWDGGRVSQNLFIHQPNTKLGNVYAIFVDGFTRSVEVENNVIHGLFTNGALIRLTDGANKKSVSFADNQLQSQIHESVLVDALGETTNYSFMANVYYSNRRATEWFKIEKKGLDLKGWKDATAATGTAHRVSFPDPTRSIETYQKALGKPETIDAFIAEALAQSKYNWREEYSAPAVNAWMRAGFTR